MSAPVRFVAYAVVWTVLAVCLAGMGLNTIREGVFAARNIDTAERE